MQIQTTFCHAAIISGQVIILAFGCGVIGAVLYYNYLSPPDQVSNLWRDYPHELTMVVTVIATVLSLISATSVYPLLSPAYHSHSLLVSSGFLSRRH
jgi:uncharacterized membrane protein YedE/YeeE